MSVFVKSVVGFVNKVDKRSPARGIEFATSVRICVVLIGCVVLSDSECSVVLCLMSDGCE